MAIRYWLSQAPKRCNTCPNLITDKFYDARTVSGGWGILCPSCFGLGPGMCRLGPGFGQEYTKQADGRFLKTGG